MNEGRVERRLAAIFAADVVGYSRLMGANEVGTLAALKAHRAELVDGAIAGHQGHIVKLTGDGMLVEFASVVNAVECAANIQRGMRTRNAEVPEDRKIEFRIGINLGDVIAEDNDIYGDGVNIATRIESIARPGGVAVSGSVRDHVGNRLNLTFDDTGEHTLKNIDRPVRVYNVALEAAGQQPGGAAKSVDKPSIAVLPFVNMSGDPEQEYFSDGITEDIITDLSKITGLSVIARNSVFVYKGKPVNMQQAARELGVKFMIEGSVRKAGQRVRITSQLIDGADGRHLWADRYDRDLTDIFALQDEITRTIVNELKVKLLPEEKKAIEQEPTNNVEAYNFYLKGRQFFLMDTRSYLTMGRRMFARAAELDPGYAAAYAGMARCDARLYSLHGVPISVDDILAAAGKALAIDPNLPEAHAARGTALMVADRRAEAVPAFEEALALDSNSFDAHHAYGQFCITGGDYERAAKHLLRATEIRPDDYQSPLWLVQVYRSLGRPEEMEKYGRLGLKRAEEALRLFPESSKPAQVGACGWALLGERDRAKEWLARALAIDPDDNIAKYNAACTYALLGELDLAFDLLEIFLQKVSPVAKLWFKNDSDLDPIRAHPRYQKLLELAG